MSTRANVGYIDNEGNIEATYNHFDGYPEGLYVDLKEFIKLNGPDAFREMIKKGQAESGFRSFPETYSDDGEWRFTDRSDVIDQEYCYLFDGETGELREAFHWGENFDPEDVLEKLRENRSA